MKPVFAAIAIIALALPAASQGGHSAPAGNASAVDPYSYTPPAATSPLALQAVSACQPLLTRTELAVANDGHQQYYYASDCECMANSIDSNSWDEATATYSGPKMSDSDGVLIFNALSTSTTIEDAFTLIDGGISDSGYSSISICYGK